MADQNENKNPHAGMLAFIALVEAAKLGKFHAKTFKIVREETDGKNLPTPMLIEMVANSMTRCIIDSESPLTESDKEMYIRAAFRSLTCDILRKNPELLTTSLDNSEKEKEVAMKDYNSKEAHDVRRAD